MEEPCRQGSEVSQTQKDKYCVPPLTRGILRKKKNELIDNREQIGVCSGVGFVMGKLGEGDKNGQSSSQL